MEYFFPLAVSGIAAVILAGIVYMARRPADVWHEITPEWTADEAIVLQAVKPRKHAAKKAAKRTVKGTVKGAVKKATKKAGRK